MGASLTVIIPCKNERLNIRACIESVRAVADEILVADSGSNDGTVELVHSLGCRIIEREYIHSGNFKNWAIPQAQHSWVLIVDADERVSVSLVTEIRRKLLAPHHDGYWIYRDNHFLGRRLRFGDWGSDKVLRLFRRDVSRYVGDTDHAEVSVSTRNVGKLKCKLTHYTSQNYDHYLNKLNHYAARQAECWHRAGVRLRLSRLFLTGPLRFLRSYVLRFGFLDGLAGFHVSVLLGWYAYMKQARLWELRNENGPGGSNEAGSTLVEDSQIFPYVHIPRVPSNSA